MGVEGVAGHLVVLRLECFQFFCFLYGNEIIRNLASGFSLCEHLISAQLFFSFRLDLLPIRFAVMVLLLFRKRLLRFGLLLCVFGRQHPIVQRLAIFVQDFRIFAFNFPHCHPNLQSRHLLEDFSVDLHIPFAGRGLDLQLLFLPHAPLLVIHDWQSQGVQSIEHPEVFPSEGRQVQLVMGCTHWP